MITHEESVETAPADEEATTPDAPPAVEDAAPVVPPVVPSEDAAAALERYNWSAHYAGKTSIVYGRTPVAEPEWLNNTLCIDTGCVYGGKLTALRWPEREIDSISACATYSERKRAFGLPPARPVHAP